MKKSLFKKICAVFAGLCIVIQSGVFVNAASRATVFVGDEEISYWAPCTDTLKIVTDADADAEISLYDLGTSLLYKQESECAFETRPESDGYTLDLKESLIEEHQYKLVVDDKEIYFKASSTGGKAEISDRIDFSALTTEDLNNSPDEKPQKDTYVTGNGGLLITKVASETRVSLKDDQSFAGGKGLQFIGRGTMDKEIIPDAPLKEGKIIVAAKLKVVNGEVEISIGNSNGALVPILTVGTNAAEIFYQNTATSSGIKTKTVANPVDGYTEISYEINFDDKSVIYRINGEEGMLEAGTMPYYNSKGNLLTYGAGFVRIEGSPTAGEYVLESLTTITYADAPDVEKITLIDNDGNAVKVDKDSVLCPEIKEIQIKFNSDMDEKMLSHINVSDIEETEVLTEGKYDAHTRIYTLELPQYLEQFGQYTINIPKDETGLVYGYSESFQTGEGSVEVVSFKLTDKSGNPIHSMYGVSDSVKVSLEILNTKLSEGKMTIVYTESNDKLMTDMICEEVEISGDKRKIECSLEVDIEDVSKINEIKAFVWNNVKEHIPQYNAVALCR